MTTLAERFKTIAKEVMPHHDDLQHLEDSVDDANHIDELMFRKGEYIGGMANVILALANKEINDGVR